MKLQYVIQMMMGEFIFCKDLASQLIPAQKKCMHMYVYVSKI